MLGAKSAIVWGGILTVLCGLSAYQVAHHWQFHTDVLALLPHTQRDPAVQSLRQLAAGNVGRMALFLVGHDQAPTAQAATRQLGTWMANSPLFESVQWDYSRNQHAFFDLYFPLRYRILSPRIRRHLDTPGGYAALIQRLTQLLYQPSSSLVTPILEDDPLLFFPALAQDWGHPAAQLQLQDGLLSRQHEGRFYHVVSAQLAIDPLATHAQAQFETQWHDWVNSLHQTWPDLVVSSTSVVRFAAATQKTMIRDLTLISIGSLLGVAILTLATFRTLKHLLLGLLPIVLGIWSAVGISLWLFGNLHALTLTFGASLIGICIDYSFHYFAHHRVSSAWHAQQTMSRLLPALSLGALTTILSYLSLAFTPLVGLQQIAVFASCGILVSFATVVFWFPFLLPQAHPYVHHVPRLYIGAKHLFTFWTRFRRPLFVGCGVLLLGCLPGLLSLRIDDSPRALNALPQDLLEQDQLIRTVMGLPHSQTYLIVKGDSAEDALQTMEQLTQLLDGPTEPPAVEFGPVLTSFLPSLKQQHANLAAVQRLLAERQAITRGLVQLGLAEETIIQFFQTLTSPPDSMLSPDTWLQHEASVGLRFLWLSDPVSFHAPTSLLVQVLRVNDRSAFHATIRGFDDVHYVDQVADFSRVFAQYRRQALWLAAGAYVFIFGVLLWRYGKRGGLVIVPPLLATFITLSMLGYFGHAFHLMHTLALLLILGMGVDYTIFIAESPPDAGPTTVLALSLSALTTLLSFGLLSLSGQAVLQAIGVTTFIGIAAAVLLAPLAQYGRPAA